MMTRCVRQAGMTLTELLIAVAVGLLVMLAAVSTLSAARRGAGTVDAASQLRDNARFATDMIQRLAVQAGFEDLASTSAPYAGSRARYAQINLNTAIDELEPSVFGYDNATPKGVSGSAKRSASDGGNGSDVLVLRYQGVRTNIDPDDIYNYSDGSMINCAGNAPSLGATNRDDRIYSILSVGVSKNVGSEPALMCTTVSKEGKADTTPLIAGVESFQVLYGVDNVTPNAALKPGNTAHSIPTRYLRASQLTVAGDTNATHANWRRVRSLRIGMVLRGPDRSAQSATQQKLFPLGNRYANADDTGSSYTVTDARLRQTVTFTVHLRNCQNQGYQPDASTQACDVTLP